MCRCISCLGKVMPSSSNGSTGGIKLIPGMDARALGGLNAIDRNLLLFSALGAKESVAPGWYPGGTPLGQRSGGLNAFQLAVGPASQGGRRSKQETHCDIFSGRWDHTVFLKALSDFRDHSTELEQLQGKIHRKPWISPPKRRNPDAWSHLSIPSRCFPKSCGGALAPGAGGQPPRHSNWGLIRIDFNKF